MPLDAGAFSLLEALSETGFQASVIATYSCYFPFYEDIVLNRLLDRGCTNNILMVDSGMCAQAFADENVRPRRAGRDYTLIPVQLAGAFHPKLLVAIGKSKGALFVGSHNMTLAGFGLNDEVTNEFRTGGAGGRQGAGVIREALNYLQTFVPASIAGVDQIFAAAKRNVPWLDGPVAPGSGDRVLITTTGEDIDLWNRVRPLIPKRPSLAFVCGPFFDRNLSFLQHVVDDVNPEKLVVGIDPESVEIDPSAVRKFSGADFVNVSGCALVPNRREFGARYLHAKILWFAGSEGELLVTGSANPSKPAYLPGGNRRNAEAIVLDRRQGAAKSLGLEAMIAAPKLEAKDWTRVAERLAERTKEDTGSSGTVILAVPAADGLMLERPIGPRIVLHAFSADGAILGDAVTDTDDEAVVRASQTIRDSAHTLRGVGADDKRLVVVIHRPDEVGRNVGGDRQRALRQALGALEEDPGQLDTLLKLTEKVIFEAVDISPAPSNRGTGGRSKEETPASGPASLAVDAVGRHAGRIKRRLASGDILVLLDALMHRLGEGLPWSTPTRKPVEEVPPAGDDDDGGDEETALLPPYELLAETCRSKVGRLVRRMVKELETAHPSRARRAVVQVAAVLSVVHALRIMEQRVEWRSKHLNLVDPDHEWLLLEGCGLALGWGGSSLRVRALEEADGEPFQELSMAIGLLSWVAWDVAIDVRAAVERKTLSDPETDEDPWYPIQVFAAVAAHLAGDIEAQEILSRAAARTARRGVDVGAWLATHLVLADRLAQVICKPEEIAKADRSPRPGDLVILGPKLDPRIRVALGVAASSGGTDKIRVFDQEAEGKERQFVATHVNCIAWWERETTRKRVGIVGL